MKQKYKGILCILSSAFFFALMSLFARLSGDISVIQKTFFRNFIALIFAAIVLFKNKPELHLNRECKIGLIARSTFGTIGVICNLYAVDHLLLADATILNKLSPFFAILMGALILGEKLKPFQVCAVLAAFGGALLVIKPGSGIIDAPAIVGLLGGFCAGTAYTMVRYLGNRNVPGPFIVFFFSAFSSITLLPFIIFSFDPMTAKQTLFILLAGFSAAAAQFSVTAAYCYAPAREISIFDYSQILFSALLGFMIFGQIPDALSFVGYLVILVTAIANFIFNNKQEQQAS